MIRLPKAPSRHRARSHRSKAASTDDGPHFYASGYEKVLLKARVQMTSRNTVWCAACRNCRAILTPWRKPPGRHYKRSRGVRRTVCRSRAQDLAAEAGFERSSNQLVYPVTNSYTRPLSEGAVGSDKQAICELVHTHTLLTHGKRLFGPD